MKQFKITVGTGPDSERDQYIDVQVTDDSDYFEDDVRGKFEPEPRIVNIDEEGNETEEIPEKFGTLKLLREELGAGYVTHELVHVLIHYIRATEIFHNKENEEMVAWEMGEWHRQFWEKWRELKDD